MALQPNFPTKPARKIDNNLCFPEDLIQPRSGRNFYTNIRFTKYDRGFAGIGGGGFDLGLGSSVKLPLPRKLNDSQVIMWQEWSGTDLVKSLVGNVSGVLAGALSVAEGPVSTYMGKQLNPFQFMMYKRPGFKEHTLQWTFTPNNQRESDTLNQIINTCKRSSLPTPSGQFVMDYPNIALVSLITPGDYLFKFKPCAIIAVQVDFTGGGQPSFFKNGAPTIVNLTLQLKEIQLWNTQNYDTQGF